METAAVRSDTSRIWTKALVLLAVLMIAALLTRCPIGDLSDAPVPPPPTGSAR